MQMELVDQEAELLTLLLVKELEETRVEVHHARNMDFKLGLESRESALRVLIHKLNYPLK
jgi:hypothetical protein